MSECEFEIRVTYHDPVITPFKALKKLREFLKEQQKKVK
jgi:hypothetical protein